LGAIQSLVSTAFGIGMAAIAYAVYALLMIILEMRM